VNKTLKKNLNNDIYAGFRAIDSVAKSENPFFDPFQQQPRPLAVEPEVGTSNALRNLRGAIDLLNICDMRLLHHMAPIGGWNSWIPEISLNGTSLLPIYVKHVKLI